MTVKESGVILENCTNGIITLSSELGPGIVTLKNCKDISVEIEGNACLLIDNKTRIFNLYIYDNASVNSLEVKQAEINNKKYVQKKKPYVENVYVMEDTFPVLENFDYKQEKELRDLKNGSFIKKLKIKQDKSYKGLGVRFLIENSPIDADVLHISFINNGINKEIAFLQYDEYKQNMESGVFEYEYLDVGKEYEFDFWFCKGKETITKYQIKAVSEKGANINFENKKYSIEIDDNTGDISWSNEPTADLPEDARIVYEIISLDTSYNWHYIGHYSTDYTDFQKINLYKDFSWQHPEDIINGKVFLHIYYKYKTYRWPIIKETKTINVSESRL